jgi:hypothetical protein
MGGIYLLTRGGGGRADWMKFMPDDAQAIVRFDMDDIRRSGLYAKVIQSNPVIEAQIKEGFRSTPLRFEDVSSIAVGIAAEPQAKVVAVIQTSRSVSESEMAGPNTKRTEKSGEYTVYHQPQGAAVLVDPRTLLAGDADTIKTVLSRGGPARLPQQLQNALAEAEFTSSIAAVAVLKGLPIPPRTFPGGGIDPSQVESGALTVDLGSSIDVKVALLFVNEAIATELKEKTEQQMNMNRQMSANMPPQMQPIKDLLDSVRIGRNGRKLTATGRIPQSVIDLIPTGRGQPAPSAGSFPTSPNQSPSGPPSRRRPSRHDPNLPPTAPARGLF